MDFKTFIKELSKKKVKLSLSDELEWEAFFDTARKQAQDLSAQIATTDDKINQLVYELYGLDDDEIALVELIYTQSISHNLWDC